MADMTDTRAADRIRRIDRGGFSERHTGGRDTLRSACRRRAHRARAAGIPAQATERAVARSHPFALTETACESLVAILSIVLIGVVAAALRATAT